MRWWATVPADCYLESRMRKLRGMGQNWGVVDCPVSDLHFSLSVMLSRASKPLVLGYSCFENVDFNVLSWISGGEIGREEAMEEVRFY